MTPPLPRRARVALASLAAAALATGVVSTTASAEPPPAANAETGRRQGPGQEGQARFARPFPPRAGPRQGRRARDGHARHDEGLGEVRRRRGQGGRRLHRHRERAVRLHQRHGSHRHGRRDREVRVRPGRRPQRVHPAAGAPGPGRRHGGGGRPSAGPGKDTPDDNPYMPTRDIGSVAFKKANSVWDGRGITIGVIDSGVDLDHPALQTTTTGERKIVDWVTGTHPLLESDGSWRAMLTTVTGPTFTVPSVRAHGPHPTPGTTSSTGSPRASRPPTRQRVTSTATVTPPTGGDPLRRGHQRHLGRRQPGPDLLVDREDAALQGEVRRRPLRCRQPRDRDRRVHARSSSSSARTST